MLGLKSKKFLYHIYLLGKHGGDSQEVSSKFLQLNRATQLLEALKKHLSPGKLKGDRIEIKEINVGVVCGTDSLVKIGSDVAESLPEENIRGHNIKIVLTKKNKIPQTKLMNFILVPFNPKFGQGVETLFKEKYGGVTFEDFEGAYAILTMFPGKYAPAFDETRFWKHHALLKAI